MEKLQTAEILHLDETPWYVKGRLQWLWVAITTDTAVFHIGSRKKEELSQLVTETFLGWLVTDGYKAYRSRKKRQRCLAHLIRSRERSDWGSGPKSRTNRTMDFRGFEGINRQDCGCGSERDSQSRKNSRALN